MVTQVNDSIKDCFCHEPAWWCVFKSRLTCEAQNIINHQSGISGWIKATSGKKCALLDKMMIW